MRILGNILAAIAAWSLALTPVAEAQFKPTASVVRSLPNVVAGLRPQDVFATSLYTGTGASQTITNGLDLAGKGGLQWDKSRNSANDHTLYDTARGAGKFLVINSTTAETSGVATQGFTSTGFSTAAYASGDSRATWAFRRAAKFFDIVTYTGDVTSGRMIPHGLGIKPGMVIVKRRDAASTTPSWPVWHAAIGGQDYLSLQTTAAVATSQNVFAAAPDASNFYVGPNANLNASGGTYVAYLFAHDPDTTNGIVQCGSYVEPNSGSLAVNIGYPIQWGIFKSSTTPNDWFIMDTARGLTSASNKTLSANTSAAEIDVGGKIIPSATGFNAASGLFGGGQTALYCVIRAPT